MMKYEYDPEKGVVELHASGVLVASDPINYFKELDADPNFKPKVEEHVYFTDLEDIQVPYDDFPAIKSAFKSYKHADKLRKVIFYTDSDLSYGVARMILSIFDGEFEEVSIIKK